MITKNRYQTCSASTEMKETNVIDFANVSYDTICRICLIPTKDMKPIFSKNIAQCVTEFASIQVLPDDNLPQNVCQHCINNLLSACDFKKRIQNSDSTLRQYLNFKKNQIVDVKQHKQSNSCCKCNKKFNCKGQLTRHLKTHVGLKKYICETCGKAYMESGSLQKHILAKHSGKEKPFKCDECGRSFDLKSTLLRHLRTHTGEKPFGCDVCCKFYPSKSYLNKHKKMHTGVNSKRFVCEICNKSFILKEGLKAHSMTHSRKRPFQCSMCDKAFSANGTLKTHVRFIHTKVKDFMCQMCAKMFVKQSDLNEHMRRHTGEKKSYSYKCDLCTKMLSTATHLKVHVRSVHTGERPFQCEFCPKNFIVNQSLKNHRRYHTGELPYHCNICNSQFLTKESLKTHKDTHITIKTS